MSRELFDKLRNVEGVLDIERTRGQCMIKIEHNIIGMCATNTYYVYDDETKRGLIIDPAGDPVRIIERVARLQINVEGILITHGHFDHVLALDEVRERFNVKAYIGNTEKKLQQQLLPRLILLIKC